MSRRRCRPRLHSASRDFKDSLPRRVSPRGFPSGASPAFEGRMGGRSAVSVFMDGLPAAHARRYFGPSPLPLTTQWRARTLGQTQAPWHSSQGGRLQDPWRRVRYSHREGWPMFPARRPHSFQPRPSRISPGTASLPHGETVSSARASLRGRNEGSIRAREGAGISRRGNLGEMVKDGLGAWWVLLIGLLGSDSRHARCSAARRLAARSGRKRTRWLLLSCASAAGKTFVG